MANNTITIEASQFSDFAKDNQDILEMVVGCIVIHSVYGQGTITGIKKRDNHIPIIYVSFESDDSVKQFNSNTFKLDRSISVDIPNKFYDLALQREKERTVLVQLSEKKKTMQLDKHMAEMIEIKAKNTERHEKEQKIKADREQVAEEQRLRLLDKHYEIRTIENHKSHLHNAGIAYKGYIYKEKTSIPWRTHCFCSRDLNSNDNPICIQCGYIICDHCGRCMCRRDA